MIEPCTILDLSLLSDAVSKTFGVESILYVRMELIYKVNKWFYKDGLAVQLQLLGDHKYALHIFGSPLRTLRETRDFIVSVGSYMMDHTTCTCILVFCKEEDMALRFLIAATGATAHGILQNANGDNNEILYVYSKDNRKTYEERMRWHKG
jgi:hypothetical protein